MIDAQKSQNEHINDLIVMAINLRSASELCGRMTKTDELVDMFDVFQRHMLEKLRMAATLLTQQEKPEGSEQ
jgi:hypothetical protein